MSARATMGARRLAVTHTGEEIIRHPACLQDDDRRRGAIALRVTLTLAGISAKGAERVFRRSQPWVSRALTGADHSAHSRLREQLRQLARAEAFPAAVVADLLADAWREAVSGKTAEEVRIRFAELHREETLANSRLNDLQADALAGREVDPDELDEALLAQAARSIEMYALHQELRRARGRS